MSEDFRLPDLGEGLPEAEIVQWHVAEGDTVSLNQTLAEVETAKAVVEIPSPFAGVVRTLHAAPGDVVDVGAVLVSVDTAAASGDAGGDGTGGTGRVEGDAVEVAATAEAEEEPAPANLVGYGAAVGTPARRRRRRAAARESSAGADTAILEAAPHDAIRLTDTAADTLAERPRSTPPVRKLAKELGVDIALITPAGPDGLITRRDVEDVAGRGRTPAASRERAPSQEPAGERETRVPVRGVRRRTAEAMVASAFTAPHATTFLTVDATETMEFIARVRGDAAPARIGVLAVAAKAVCLSLRRHSSLNARWHERAGEIVEFGYVNLGIAAATPRGLLVPRIADADAMTLAELATELSALTERARSGRSTPAELTGSTFSITNVGVFGVDAGTPILNPGEAGILALGAVRRMPWEHEGAIALRSVVTLSLSFDHRVVDGEQAASFLRDVGALLADPARAMLLA